jgi:hypothetical protein
MSILTLVEVESQRFQNGRDFSEKRVRGSGSLASESFHSTMNGYHMNGMESAYVGRAEEDVGIGSPQSPAGNPLPCPCRNPSVSFEYWKCHESKWHQMCPHQPIDYFHLLECGEGLVSVQWLLDAQKHIWLGLFHMLLNVSFWQLLVFQFTKWFM